VTSAELIREARLRAGLSQQELAERSGRDRTVIARWEQGAVAPSLESVLDVVRACGFDLPLELVPQDPSRELSRSIRVEATPEQRFRQLLPAGAPATDPRPRLAALERARVSYVLIGSLARFVRGVDEESMEVEIVPSLRPDNLRRLTRALRELGADSIELDRDRLVSEPLMVDTPAGAVRVTGRPPATRRGYDDLRRDAPRERLERGLRPAVASSSDLARLLVTDPEHDPSTLAALRQIAELERAHSRGLGL
jgi:transcriptional regulator with XRE-family HTH domain